MTSEWNLYPMWYKNFVNKIKKRHDEVVDAESKLKNKDFDYAKSMQRMIALYDDVLKVCESHAPNQEEME